MKTGEWVVIAITCIVFAMWMWLGACIIEHEDTDIGHEGEYEEYDNED